MFRFGFLFRFLFALLLIGLLAVGGMALFRSGYTQGYQVGALAASAASKGTTPPLPAYGYPPMGLYPGYGYPMYGSPFGLFFGIGLFVLFLFMIGGIFRMMAWRHWAGAHGSEFKGPDFGPGGPPWHRHWHEYSVSHPEKGPESVETQTQA